MDGAFLGFAVHNVGIDHSEFPCVSTGGTEICHVLLKTQPLENRQGQLLSSEALEQEAAPSKPTSRGSRGKKIATILRPACGHSMVVGQPERKWIKFWADGRAIGWTDERVLRSGS